MVIDMSRNESDQERWWRALCYIAVYNVPFGEVLWQQLPWSTVRDYGMSDFHRWCDGVFRAQTLVTRFERRCVRRADWMTEYLTSARELVLDIPRLAEACARQLPEDAYELAWNRVCNTDRIGRYVAIKLLELWRRDGTLQIATPDIRPKGAWSPRKTLGELFPGTGVEARDDNKALLETVRHYSREAVARLAGDYGVEIDLFELQVVLCEYRESWEGKKQYPGRSLDSELGYARKAKELWGVNTELWNTRVRLFPLKHLGELNGWEGPRKEVAVVLHDYGYTWSDLLFDFTATKNMREPVSWPSSSSK
jgi:hypothetical protein